MIVDGSCPGNFAIPRPVYIALKNFRFSLQQASIFCFLGGGFGNGVGGGGRGVGEGVGEGVGGQDGAAVTSSMLLLQS